MRALGLGVCLAAAFGAAAVADVTLEHVARPPAERAPASENPACAPGADFSAAFCAASQADPDAPIATAGRAPPMVWPTPQQARVTSDAAPIELAADDPPPSDRAAPSWSGRMAEAPGAATASPPINAPSATEMLHQAWAEHAATALPNDLARPQTLSLPAPLRQRFEDMKYAGHRARAFLFVGGGDDVLAYNITRAEGDIRIAGWSMERTVQLGEQQIGFAWENGRMRLAAAGLQRKVSQYGVALKDKVAAICLSITTGDPRPNRNLSTHERRSNQDAAQQFPL